MSRPTLFSRLVPHRPASVIDAVRFMWPVVDCACILLAWQVLAALLDYQSGLRLGALLLTAGLGVRIGALVLLGQYRSVFRYCGLHALVGVATGVLAGTVVLLLAWAAT